MRGLCLTIQPNDFNDSHLQQLVHRGYLIEDLEYILHSLGHGAVGQEYKCIALARRVGLGGQERLDELRRVRDEVVELAVDGVDSKHRALADVRMAVFEAGAANGDEGLEDLDILRDLL